MQDILSNSPAERPLDPLDRAVFLYLAIPLLIFLVGWLALWATVPLCLCVAYSLRRLIGPWPAHWSPSSLPRSHVMIAVLAGCGWTLCGGTWHALFANADWHIRDAVLHDLVSGAWPVAYATAGGETILRAPIGYYLPAALIGKALGLATAHVALAAWTAAGATLFLLQVLSQVPRRTAAAIASVVVVMAFSGLDAVGTVLRTPASVAHWDITRHLEWWAVRYQYSSMTTQLFWVPNHALGGWLGIGLLYRLRERARLEPALAMMVVAVTIWSPLTALGLVPFVLWRTFQRESWRGSLHPRVWLPALAVGLAVAAYLTLDATRIPSGWTLGRQGLGPAAVADDLWRHIEFYVLEVGLLGAAILAIRSSACLVLALGILAVLPVVRFGAANDFVMRASIPSLTVLALSACLALFAMPGLRVRKAILVGLLLIGAITPMQEFARALVLEPWPSNLDATLIDAACGSLPANYVARLSDRPIEHLLRQPRDLAFGGMAGSDACRNPAWRIERLRARSRW